MSIFSFADISAAMPQLYRELRPQIQRKTPFLAYLPAKPVTTGQNIGWDVTFSGQAVGSVNADGGSFLTATADVRVPAQLSSATVSAPMKITTKAAWTGAAQNSADFFRNLSEQNFMEAINACVKYLNQQLFNGTGSASQLTGLSTAVATTGTYANISQSTYSGWASSASGNSGSLRSLTLALIKSLNTTISTVSPVGRADKWVMKGAVFDTLESLFDGSFQVQAGRNDLQWGKVMTNAGMIDARGFRSLAWPSAGITFIEDPDCLNTAVTNQSNCIYALNSESVELQYWQPAPTPYNQDQKIVQAVEQDLGALSGIQFELRPRGRTSFSDEFDLLAMCNLVVKDRTACGILYDVQ